jgi:predicted DsbA family dithiol-disulfide isomerase
MTPEQVSAAQTRLTRVGAASGIQFKFGGYIGSSRLAHRLLHIVREKKGSEVQDRLAEMLFHYQFEREADVSQVDGVVAGGGRVGLGEEEVREWLAGDEGIKEIEEQGRRARDAGVKGVPHIIVKGQYQFDGALDVSEFFEAVVQARQSSLSQ